MKKLILFCSLVIGMIIAADVNAQVTTPFNFGLITDFVGWNGAQPFPLRIEQQNIIAPQPINFSTNGSQKMTILGSLGSNDGYVGIGNAAYIPQFKLDVDGDINVGLLPLVGYTNAYKIGGSTALVHVFDLSSLPSCLFVGIGAGAGGALIGANNTFVGYNAGNKSTTFNTFDNTFFGYQAGYSTGLPGIGTGLASENTFIGSWAGYSNTDGEDNDFEGQCAGKDNTSGNDNTFIGHWSGTHNIDGSNNTSVGAYSLNNLGTGGDLQYNVAVGDHALFTTNATLQNTAIGGLAGYANDGDNNTFVGFSADAGSSGLSNASAIGANAQVTTNNTMILGGIGSFAQAVNVGIGLSGAPGGPLARLHVQRDLTLILIPDPTGIKVENNDVSKPGTYSGNAFGINSATLGANDVNYGGSFDAENAATNVAGNFGAAALVASPANLSNYGIQSTAANADNNYGIFGRVTNGKFDYGANFSVSNAATFSVAGMFRATAGPTTAYNYGVVGLASPTHTILNAAIYGNAPVNPVGPPPPIGTGTWAGYFAGDLGYTGTLYALSDSNLKTNIEPLSLDTANAILSQLNTYTYNFDTLQLQGSANVPTSLQFGFMAQQIETVAPNLVINTILPPVFDSLQNVVTPARPVKMYNPLGILPLLVAANKSLSSKDSALEERVEALEQIVNSCCGSHRLGDPTQGQGSNEQGEPRNTGSIELQNLQALQLLEADPNPFSESTIIRWNIPNNFKEAIIYFYDNNGSKINSYKIENKGIGELQIFGSKLSSGTYSYSLVVDSRLIDSKKLIKSK